MYGNVVAVGAYSDDDKGSNSGSAYIFELSENTGDWIQRDKLTADDVKWLVPHQANLRIIDATAERMGIGKDKVMINIDRYGNTTAGTIPICLSELHLHKKVSKGDYLVLSSFGAGYTWGSVLVRWSIDS